MFKCLSLEKGFNAFQMMREFPSRKCKKRTLNDLIRKIDETGSGNRASFSGRPRSLRELMKTFRWSRNSFVARKANQERAKVPEK